MKNAAAVYLSKWPTSSDTHRTMRAALGRVVAALEGDGDPNTFDWSKLRFDDVRAVPAALAEEDFSPRTINQALSALRGVLDIAWRQGALPDDEYRKIVIDNVPGSGGKAGRALPAEEMEAIHKALSSTEPEDAAVLALLAGAGLRRIELVRLQRADYEMSTGRVTARGKRDKPRQVPVGDRWRPFVERWCACLPAGPMFDLGRRQVSYVVERFHLTNGLPAFTPHDLRRTFGTHVEKTIGMEGARQLLGHSNIQTTALYVRVDEERERAAVKDL